MLGGADIRAEDINFNDMGYLQYDAAMKKGVAMLVEERSRLGIPDRAPAVPAFHTKSPDFIYL